MPWVSSAVVAVLSLLPVLAAGPLASAEEAASSPQEALAARVQKQIEAVETDLAKLQEQEINLTMEIMKAQQKANEGLKEPSKAAEELAKGTRTRELIEFRTLMIRSAQQIQAFDGKWAPLVKAVKALERDREAAPKELKTRIDDITARVEGKHRQNLEKVALFYEQVAEWKPALGIWLTIMKGIPEPQRAKDKSLTEKIASLYDKVGDHRNSLALYKSLFDAKPEKDRYRDRELGEKVGKQYEEVGDLKTAVQLYRALLEALPKDKRETDGKGLRDKITEIEKKMGRPSR